VPQVLAATAPIGPVSVQIGTFVKLVRVLLLGPVVTALSVLARRWSAVGDPGGAARSKGRLVPWFILGFLALMALRSLGAIPAILFEPIGSITKALTVLAMAALGIGVDARDVARAGGPVTLTVVLSLALLTGLSVALIALGVGG
jgi:uncharacterized membrane protein YadS